MGTFYSVAIDGPSGAGKSTIARAAAGDLGFVYLDTGAIYRTVAWHLDIMGISPRDKDRLPAMLEDMAIEIDFRPDGQHMILNGRDISADIRTPEISRLVSAVAAQPAVRDFLLDMQRQQATKHNIIMDGRDIGTVVLPDADVKIFLTASAEARARRRFLELQEKGEKETFEEVLADQNKRDYDDTHRAVAPLRQAEDAILIDTTELSLEDSVLAVEAAIRERLGL